MIVIVPAWNCQAFVLAYKMLCNNTRYTYFCSRLVSESLVMFFGREVKIRGSDYRTPQVALYKTLQVAVPYLSAPTTCYKAHHLKVGGIFFLV